MMGSKMLPVDSGDTAASGNLPPPNAAVLWRAQLFCDGSIAALNR